MIMEVGKKTMKAAQVIKHGFPLEIKDVEIPTPGVGELLVRLEVSGVCHTDVHVQMGDWKVKCPLPMTAGHEGVGNVVGIGGVHPNSKSFIKIGDRVTIPWLHSSCGQCEHCWDGWETVCGAQKRTVCWISEFNFNELENETMDENERKMLLLYPPLTRGYNNNNNNNEGKISFTSNGTFAQYCLVDSAFAVPVPIGLSSEQAAVICCAGVTVYKGLKISQVRPGQWVVIVGGSGNLGHVAIQYAKAMGVRVIGVDRGQVKCDFMKQLGCDFVVDAMEDDGNLVVDKIKSGTDGHGAHGALIIAPVSKLIGQAVKYMRPRGTVVIIGLPSGKFEADVFDVVLNAVSIRGSIVGTRLDLQEALNLAVDGKIKCHIRKRHFEDIQAVLDDLKEGKVEGCVVVDIP